MSSAIRIEIPGVPRGKGRPRFVRVTGRVYSDAATRNYEDLLRLAAGQEMNGRAPLEGPLAVAVQAFLPIPKSFSKRKRADADAGLTRPISRPDVDNFVKAALDGLNGIAFRDDSQVVELLSWKHYSEKPRLVVTVRELAPGAAGR